MIERECRSPGVSFYCPGSPQRPRPIDNLDQKQVAVALSKHRYGRQADTVGDRAVIQRFCDRMGTNAYLNETAWEPAVMSAR